MPLNKNEQKIIASIARNMVWQRNQYLDNPTHKLAYNSQLQAVIHVLTMLGVTEYRGLIDEIQRGMQD